MCGDDVCDISSAWVFTLNQKRKLQQMPPRDLNARPLVYKTNALTPELQRPLWAISAGVISPACVCGAEFGRRAETKTHVAS